MNEVLPDPLEKWLEDFRRDDEPEPEVVLWEKIAGHFLMFTEPSDPEARKREVARVLLDCSSNSAAVSQLAARCKHLSRDEVHNICVAWKQ